MNLHPHHQTQMADLDQNSAPVENHERDRRRESRSKTLPQQCGTGTPPNPVAAHEVFRAEFLGSESFRSDYGLRYAYASGSMYKGIASKELVVRMGRAGLLGFFGTGGLKHPVIEDAIGFIQARLDQGQAYGMNLLAEYENPDREVETVALFLRNGIRFVEASAFMKITPALVWFRFKGAFYDRHGRPRAANQLIAKISRPEVAEKFMSPPPQALLLRLLEQGRLTAREVEIAGLLPMAHDICVEADSGGHTDCGNAYTLMPAMIALRDRLMKAYPHGKIIRIGAAGGIGTASSAAAAFLLGADFIITGSVNQCSPEAATSDAVKDLLQTLNVQDTDYAPAGDMFEIGARVQVVKRGVFFPARANKLYDLYRHHQCLEDINPAIRKTIQEKYFGRSFDQVWNETRAYLAAHRPAELAKAQRAPKHKMALVFKWYFIHSNRMAMKGDPGAKMDYQIHCGPAMGAFNQVVKGTNLEDWRHRHVNLIAAFLMNGAAQYLNRRFQVMARHPTAPDR